MRIICLLALLSVHALAPHALAQDDDAELGKAPAPAESPESFNVDDSAGVEPDPPISAVPAAPLQATPSVQEAEEPETSPSTPEPAQAGSSGFKLMEGRRRPGATFGFGAFRPDKIGKYNHYNYLYGKEKVAPHLYGGYYLFSYLVDIGLVGRVGYYHAEGHPLSARPTLPLDRDLDDETKDESQKLGLTLIPVQMAAEVALAPFKTRWIVLRAWMGLERLYVQETIEPKLPASATSSNASTYTTSGWNAGLAKGMMASFSLTGLDARSDNSLRSLGIDRFYLSIFAENITSTSDKFGNFDRKNYGIAFSFEGLR